MPVIHEQQWPRLATALRREVAVYAPSWTDINESDPGIALLQLFAFLTEDLNYRSERLGDRGVAAAQRLADAAHRLAIPPDATEHALRRPNFYEGQLLTADDLSDEQSYFRARLGRRNRALHGAGVVTGLEVSIDRSGAAGGDRLHVEPGLAFDARGEEIAIAVRQTLTLPAGGSSLSVVVRYAEIGEGPRPDAVGDLDGAALPSRTAETFVLALAPTPGADDLELARARVVQGHWRLDKRSKPRHVRR
jgi:hypothetical protein